MILLLSLTLLLTVFCLQLCSMCNTAIVYLKCVSLWTHSRYKLNILILWAEIYHLCLAFFLVEMISLSVIEYLKIKEARLWLATHKLLYINYYLSVLAIFTKIACFLKSVIHKTIIICKIH